MYFVVPPKSVTTCMSSQSIPGAATCIATRPFSKSSIVSICNARQCFCIRYFLGNTPHTHIYALLCPHVSDAALQDEMKFSTFHMSDVDCSGKNIKYCNDSTFYYSSQKTATLRRHYIEVSPVASPDIGSCRSLVNGQLKTVENNMYQY